MLVLGVSWVTISTYTCTAQDVDNDVGSLQQLELCRIFSNNCQLADNPRRHIDDTKMDLIPAGKSRDRVYL